MTKEASTTVNFAWDSERHFCPVLDDRVELELVCLNSAVSTSPIALTISPYGCIVVDGTIVNMNRCLGRKNLLGQRGAFNGCARTLVVGSIWDHS
jgi:hypothetical protein